MTRIKDHLGIVEIIGLGMILRTFYLCATTNKGSIKEGMKVAKGVADLVMDRIKELEEWGEKE